MADKRLIDQKDAKYIGESLNSIHSRLNTTPKNVTPSRPVRSRKGIPAKITQVGEDGLYSLKEQIIGDDGKSFEDKDSPRIWDGTEGNLPQAYEINGNEELNKDNIVYVWSSGSNTSNKNKWFFDGAGSSGSSSGVAVKNHIVIDKKKLQFDNDVAEAAIDSELGPALYSELYFADVAWRYLWNKKLPAQGTMIPQPGVDSSGDLDLTDLNTRHIRYSNMFAGGFRQLMIYHGVIPDASTASTHEMWPGHDDANAGGHYILDRTTVDAITNDANPLTHSEFLSCVVRVQKDKLGHDKKIGSDYASTPYEPDDPTTSDPYKLDVSYTGSYPTSGTLFDVSIGQTTKITDGAGADVTYLGNNVLEWQVIPGWASIIKSALDPNVALNQTTIGDATNYAGASHGNNTAMHHDLARYYNTNFRLKGTLTPEGVTGTSDTLLTDTVYFNDPEFQSTPADATNFTVWCYMTDSAGGAQYSRHNGSGEYRVVGFLYWKSAGFDHSDPDGNLVLQSVESDVVSFDTASKSGAELVFNTTINESDESDELCVAWYVEFYNHADAVAESYGYIYGADGSFLYADACSSVANTGTNYNFTLTLTPDSITDESTIVTQGDSLVIDDLGTSIVVDLSIDDGGADTTDFSDDSKTVTIWVEYNGSPIIFNDVAGNSPQDPHIGDIDGDNPYTNTIVANHGTTTTDGYTFTLEAMQGNPAAEALLQGTYTVKARIQGYATIEIATFEVVSSESLFCWSDNFNSPADRSNSGFPIADNYDGTGFNSGTTTDDNFTERYTQTSLEGTASITAGKLRYTIDSGNPKSIRYDNEVVLPAGDFETEITVNMVTYTDDNSISQAANFRLETEADVFLGGIYINKADSATNANWGIVTDGDLAFQVEDDAWTSDTVTFKMVRIGDETTFYYNGNASTNTLTYNGAVKVYLSGVSRWTSGNLVIDWSDLTGVDADGNGVYSLDSTRWANTSGVGSWSYVDSLGKMKQVINNAAVTTTIENQFSAGANPDITSETWLTSVDLSNIALPSVTSELITLLRVSQTTNTLEMGYVRDNGTNQQLVVRVNATDEVLEDDSSATATLLIERDNYQFSDDWSGADQNSTEVGGGKFPGRWLDYGTDGTATIDGANNEIDIDVPTGGGGSFEFQGYRNSIALKDGFEVTMTMDVTQVEANNGVSSGVGFDVFVAGVAQLSCAMNKIGADTNAEWRISSENAADGLFVEQSDYGSDSVTFKIIYDGATLTMEYNGNGMTRTYATTSDDITIAWAGGTRSTVTDFQATFSAITIDTEQYEKRALFYKGTDLKHAYDDSGEDLTQIDIELDSVGTQTYTQEYDNFIIESPEGTDYCTDA